MTRAIAVDFDGVIHEYSKGWHDGTIYDSPKTGAIEGLKLLQEKYAVFIHTTRDIAAVANYLSDYGLSCTILEPETFWNDQARILVTNKKYPAIAYIDDRAFHFTDWNSVLMQFVDVDEDSSHG